MGSKSNLKCKCCNANLSGQTFQQIFDEKGEELNVAFLFSDFTNRPIVKKPGTTQAICMDCLKQLQRSYEFKIKCIKRQDSDTSEGEEIVEEAEIEGDGNANGIDLYTEFIEFNVEQVSDVIDTKTIQADLTGGDYEIEYLDDEYCLGKFKSEIDRTSYQIVTVDEPFKSSDTDKKIIIKSVETIKDVSNYQPNNTDDDESKNCNSNQIMTSVDLINIRQDRGIDKRKRFADEEEICFDLPTIENNCSVDDPVNVDEYIKSISDTQFKTSEHFNEAIICAICNHNLYNHTEVMNHTVLEHGQNNQFSCIFDTNCLKLCRNEISNHAFSCHYDPAQITIRFVCESCDEVFETNSTFNKHMCLSLHEDDVKPDDENLICLVCDQLLPSVHRFLFHKQFHMDHPRPKICLICKRNFSGDGLNFYNHVMYAHEAIREYFCNDCDMTFSTEQNLEMHKRGHDKNRIYTCTECNKSFSAKHTLDMHIRTHLPDIKYECDICGQMYGRKNLLKRHITTHIKLEAEDLDWCSVCHEAFTTLDAGIAHCQNVHESEESYILTAPIDKVFCCEYCENPYVEAESLLQHRKCHEGIDKPFKCRYCICCFDSFSKVATHRNAHPQRKLETYPVERHYLCTQSNCAKSFHNWSDLKSHERSNHLLNPTIFKCLDCMEVFYQGWRLKYHRDQMHGPPICCDICLKKFASIQTRDKHKQMVHSSDAPQIVRRAKLRNDDCDALIHVDEDNVISCKECGKTFPLMKNCRVHVNMVHLKIRRFFCDVCNKGFYQMSDKNDHMRLHTLELPFICPTCNYKTRTSSMLKRHERMHSDERPFKCHMCEKSFRRSYVLNLHIKHHIGIKDFHCEFCDCSYINQSQLNYHVRQKHLNPNPKSSIRGRPSRTIQPIQAPSDEIIYVMDRYSRNAELDVNTVRNLKKVVNIRKPIIESKLSNDAD